MKRLSLFVFSCLLGGAGGILGSIVGNAAGKTGLFVGGFVGGLLATSCVGRVARARKWIAPPQVRSTSVGAMLGFSIAAVTATQTLGSPIGPVLSTSLIGVGALLGARRGRSGPLDP